MINYRLRSTQLIFIFTFLLLITACQDGPVEERVDIDDEDLIAATLLAEEYLNSKGARNGGASAITILKYHQGKLKYATTTDDIGGYTEIDEETITATAEPGDHIFWYGGGGVSDLEGIDFDATSQAELDDLPDEINPDHMWVIIIPEDAVPGTILKYDITYQVNGSSGPPIVLDPKVQVDQ